VAIVDADGSDLTVIARGAPHAEDSCEGDPSFTPDGSRLVFERYDPVLDVDALWSMDLDGSDRELITEFGAVDPNVSPDGRWVGFLAGRERVQRIYRVGIHGGDPVAVTPSLYGNAFKWDWAPDGEHVVFTDNANDVEHAANVATIRSDGSDLQYLTHYRQPDERAYVGSYSPDGHWIVFRLEIGGRFGLYRIRPDGNAMHPILRLSDLKPRTIDWGPAAG
jgi:Tol biopolymer transport system component